MDSVKSQTVTRYPAYIGVRQVRQIRLLIVGVVAVRLALNEPIAFGSALKRWMDEFTRSNRGQKILRLISIGLPAHSVAAAAF